jgi:hypothetical protein
VAARSYRLLSVPMSPKKDPYEQEWQELDRLIRNCLLSTAIGLMLLFLGQYVSPFAPVVILPLWSIFSMYYGVQWAEFPCPHCKKSFFKEYFWHTQPFRSDCVHCGYKCPK